MSTYPNLSQHRYDIGYDGVTDLETLMLVDDFAAVYRSVFQGVMIGDWLEARVMRLIKKWLPDWRLSHAQIIDPTMPDLQSRSWDIVVHRPVPSELHLPPPAYEDEGYPLLPKALCCAAIDCKGRYDTPQTYARKTAFNVINTAITPQLEILSPTVTPILFIMASTLPEQTVVSRAREHGLSAFVLAHARDHGLMQGHAHVTWTLNGGSRQQPPLQEFKACLEEAAGRWQAAHEVVEREGL